MIDMETTNTTCVCCDNPHDRGGYNLPTLGRDRVIAARNDARQFGDEFVTIKHPSQFEHSYTFEQIEKWLRR